LLLVVDQDEKAAIVVVEGIDAHQLSRSSRRHERNKFQTHWRSIGSIQGFGKIVRVSELAAQTLAEFGLTGTLD
jgi:hypothetical protein